MQRYQEFIEHIECASLTIVDNNGQPVLRFGTDGDSDGQLNYLAVYQPGGKQHAIDIFAMTQSTGLQPGHAERQQVNHNPPSARCPSQTAINPGARRDNP